MQITFSSLTTARSSLPKSLVRLQFIHSSFKQESVQEMAVKSIFLVCCLFWPNTATIETATRVDTLEQLCITMHLVYRSCLCVALVVALAWKLVTWSGNYFVLTSTALAVADFFRTPDFFTCTCTGVCWSTWTCSGGELGSVLRLPFSIVIIQLPSYLDLLSYKKKRELKELSAIRKNFKWLEN